MHIHGLRTIQVEDQRKFIMEFISLTHWNNICFHIVHSWIVFPCPCKTNINPTFEFGILNSQVLPGGHEHSKSGYCTCHNWIWVTGHDLLNTVRHLLLCVRFCSHIFSQAHTSRTTWTSNSTVGQGLLPCRHLSLSVHRLHNTSASLSASAIWPLPMWWWERSSLFLHTPSDQ